MMSFRGTSWLSSACFILLRVFRLFLLLSFFLIFLWILLLFGFRESLSILKIKQRSVPRFLDGVSKDGLVQPYLVINVTGLVQFGKNLCYILTILTWKNLCFIEFSTKIHRNTRLAASDVFHVFTQSIKFF